MQPIEQVNKETIFILSAEKSSEGPRENMRRTDDLERLLETNKVPFKPLLGSFFGTEEASFLIVGEKHESLVARLSFYFDQESYFKSLPSRESFLVYNDGLARSLGNLVAVTEAEAKQSKSWSYCFELKQYYTTRK